jgi:hypothetical protein
LYLSSFDIRSFQPSERCVEYMLYCLGMSSAQRRYSYREACCSLAPDVVSGERFLHVNR